MTLRTAVPGQGRQSESVIGEADIKKASLSLARVWQLKFNSQSHGHARCLSATWLQACLNTFSCNWSAQKFSSWSWCFLSSYSWRPRRPISRKLSFIQLINVFPEPILHPNRLWFMTITAKHNTPDPMIIALKGGLNMRLCNGQVKQM